MNLLRRLRFHLWYYQKPPWDTGISPPELMKFITGHLPGRALDLGCGTGTNVITLALHGWQAVGVDFVPRAVYLARRKARQAGVEAVFLVEDVTRLEDLFRRETHPFDLVLDIGCLHSLSRQAADFTSRTWTACSPHRGHSCSMHSLKMISKRQALGCLRRTWMRSPGAFRWCSTKMAST